MKRLFALALACLLAACGSSQPSTSDIRAAFEQEMPGLLELKDFKLEQARNTGSEENPVWVARAIATVAPREATYEIDTVEGSVRILKPVFAAGQSFNTYGTVRSVPSDTGWRHSFQNDGSSNPTLGRPRGDYGPDALVAGSPEADALLAEIKRKREEARIAEETRIAAEAAEQKRKEEAEAAKRQRIEAAVAKHRAGFAPPRLGDLVGNDEKGAFLVTASTEGQGNVWGTDEYTCGSNFAKVVVHAGILANGETGIVEVKKINQSRRNFLGSPRNGVSSGSDDFEYNFCTLRLLERIPAE